MPAANGESDIRVPVEQRLQSQLRLYRRLWLARVDLEEAKATADEILRAKIRIPRRERPPPLLLSLTTALVVAYARPWIYSRGQSVAERTAPGSLLRTLTANQRELHNYLIDLRNRELAHSDADIVDLHLRLEWNGDSAILRTSREPFRRSELGQIRRIIEKIDAAMENRCGELRAVLPRHQWI